MMLSSYLCSSRHGVFYFRWPLPNCHSRDRKTLRLSLQTKCPDEAGDLARYLALCSKSLKENRLLATLRQDEIRSFVKAYFKRSLETYRDSLGVKGAHESAEIALSEELQFHAEGLEGFDDISDQYLDYKTVPEFRAFAGIDDTAWNANEPRLRKELRKGRRDVISAMLREIKQLDHYSFTERTSGAKSPVEVSVREASATLVDAVCDYIAEMSRQWADKTTKQNQAYLNVMLDYFGKDKALVDITKKDASALKKVLQEIPSSRNTKPALKGLSVVRVFGTNGRLN